MDISLPVRLLYPSSAARCFFVSAALFLSWTSWREGSQTAICGAAFPASALFFLEVEDVQVTSIGASSSSLSDPPSPSGALLFVVFVAFHLHDHFLEHRRPLVEGQVARNGAHCGHRLKGVAGLGILGTFVDRMSGREKNRGGRPICQHLRVRSQHRHTNIYNVRRRHSHGEREEHPGHAPCPHPPPLRRPLQRLPQPPQRPPPPVHLDVHHVPPEILILLRVVAQPR